MRQVKQITKLKSGDCVSWLTDALGRHPRRTKIHEVRHGTVHSIFGIATTLCGAWIADQVSSSKYEQFAIRKHEPGDVDRDELCKRCFPTRRNWRFL